MMGIGYWGLGIGDWAQSPIPNPQSPIPTPITIKKQKKSFLTIYISQIDNVNNEKQIQFNVPIYEVIYKNKICYLFNNKDEQKYLIDFFSIY